MRDPYDARVAFDDVLGGGVVPYIPGIGIPGIPIIGDGRSDIVDPAGAVVRELRKRRFGRPVRHTILGAVADTTEWSFQVLGETRVVGVDAAVKDGDYPLYDLLRVRFRRAIGEPKLIRLDDQESYEAFRAARREPYLASLDDRLGRLEREMTEHVSDNHGGGRLMRLEQELLSHIEDSAAHLKPQPPYDFVGSLAQEIARGGHAVDLGLPPSANGKVECWVDADEVLVSARLPQGIATTGAPFLPELEELVGLAEMIGCCGLEALLLGCQVAPATAGRQLLGELCQVSPDIDCMGVAEMRPEADAAVAAAMALLQRGQRGDRQAIREALSLAHGDGRQMMERARERLVHGQERKARRS